jgi:uncharacterized membrane protein
VIFLAVLAVATALVAVVMRRADAKTWLRLGLGLALVVAGVAHLVNPVPFEQHLPSWVPATELLVLVSGIVEIALGIALLLARHGRRRLGQATALFFIAVWPANIYVALAGVDVEGQPGGLYPWLRVVVQPAFIALALWCTSAWKPGPAATVRRHTDARRPSSSGR